MNARERNDLLISWITISIAFAWVFGRQGLNIGRFLTVFPMALVAVGTGFILHELAHKYTAIHFGARAEYRAWMQGLVFALLTSLVGFVFAAPGATYIFGGHINAKKNALISLAGPATNIVLGLAFVGIAVAMGPYNAFRETAGLTASVNLFLALFNMIPVFPLDGSKVFAWNKGVWAIVFVPLLVMWLSGLMF